MYLRSKSHCRVARTAVPIVKAATVTSEAPCGIILHHVQAGQRAASDARASEHHTENKVQVLHDIFNPVSSADYWKGKGTGMPGAQGGAAVACQL